MMIGYARVSTDARAGYRGSSRSPGASGRARAPSFCGRPAVRASYPGKRRRDKGRGGRWRISGEQVQIADRRMAQAQGIDREAGARLGGEKAATVSGVAGKAVWPFSAHQAQNRATAAR